MASEKFSNLSQILAKIQKMYPQLSKRFQEAEAVSRWEKVVGPMISKHARALRVQDGVLLVEVDHPVWRSELHHRKRQILDSLNSGRPSENTPPLTDIFLVEPRTGRA